MKKRIALAALFTFFAGLSLCLAADPNMGTWKLNDAKSKFAPGTGKNTMVVYAPAAGDMVTVTVDGVDKDGKAVHNTWTGKFDGKDYPVTGEAAYDARSYTKVDANTMDLTVKKAGKPVVNGRIVIAADGKSRTLTTNPAGSTGAATMSTAVYDKQ